MSKFFSVHQILQIGLIAFIASCCLFDQTQSMLIRCICYSFASASTALFEVFANIAVLEIF